jgi:hypothetical protein
VAEFKERTPKLAIVGFCPEEIEIPGPAVKDNIPVLAIVAFVVPVIDIPVPAVSKEVTFLY